MQSYAEPGVTFKLVQLGVLITLSFATIFELSNPDIEGTLIFTEIDEVEDSWDSTEGVGGCGRVVLLLGIEILDAEDTEPASFFKVTTHVKNAPAKSSSDVLVNV